MSQEIIVINKKIWEITTTALYLPDSMNTETVRKSRKTLTKGSRN